MSEISVGSAVGAGFQLILRRPLSVLAWGLLRVGFVAAVLALYAPVLIGMVSDIAAKSASGAEPTQADMSQIMSHMFLLQGVGFLAQIVGLVLTSMILCAVTRAVVHPEKSAFAFLRLGAPELFLMIISFGAGIVLVFGVMILAIPFTLLGVFLGVQHYWVALAVVIGLAVLVLVFGLIYIFARFAFVVPMMVDDGRFHLFDAWTLTKGRVGGIVLIGLCLFLIASVLGLVIEVVFVGLGAAALGMAAGGLDNLQAYFTHTPPMQILAALAPSLILLSLLTIPIQGAFLAIFYAPWARAYRDVVPAAPLPITPPPLVATP